MWIRSQSKETLINSNEMWINDTDGNVRIIAVNSTINTGGGNVLGHYKTKERAIEILDDIQDTIRKLLVCQTTRYKIGCIPIMIYEMPQE